MSLGEQNSGLLDTHISWEDIQNDLLEIFGPSAVLGEQKTIRDVADGRGFVSRIGVVENPWKDVSQAEKSGCPSKFAIKMITLLQQKKYGIKRDEEAEKHQEEVAKKEEFFRKVHNVEATIYEKLVGEKDLDMLNIYKTVPFTEENPGKGYLIMEYVEDVVKLGTESEFYDDLVDQVLKSLAKFHSKTQKFSSEEKNRLKMRIYTDMFGKMNDPKMVSTITTKLVGSVPERTIEILKKASEKFREKEYSEKLDKMAGVLGMEEILCHGDPWTVNLLLVKGDEDRIRLKALIDFQVCHFGCVGHDLSRLLCSVVDSKRRRENEDKYIASYFSYLSSFWPKGSPLPFSEQQVKESYRNFLPFAAFIIILTLAAVGEMTAKKTEDPEKTWNILKQKIVHLADDINDMI